MVRLYFVLIGVGAFLIFTGYQEYQLTSSADAEPTEVEIATLEAGIIPENGHLRIGEHWAVYSYGVGYGPENNDALDYFYYPIISEGHPFNQAIDAVLQKYGDREIPEEEIPVFGSCAVLVKTKQYERMRDVPSSWEQPAAVQGLVINRISSLNEEVRVILRESFPMMDFEQVILLEEGKQPQSSANTYGMMGGGGALALFGGFLLLRRFNRRN